MYPCPNCRQFAIVERGHVTGVGLAVVVLGIVIAFFTCGFGLIVSILGLLIRDRVAQCSACGWTPEVVKPMSPGAIVGVIFGVLAVIATVVAAIVLTK